MPKYFYPLPIPLPEIYDVTVEIPEWQHASDMVHAGKPTPLDIFVNHHEPEGIDALQFRRELQDLLDYVFYCASLK